MADPPVAVPRIDPYRSYRYRLQWDGRDVAGATRVTGLERPTEAVKHRDGGDPSTSRKRPGHSPPPAVTLEDGITLDPEFHRWASSSGDPSWSPGRRIDVLIQVDDEAGRPTLSYALHRCWVSEFQGLPDLDGRANAVVIHHLRLEHEGEALVRAPGDNP